MERPKPTVIHSSLSSQDNHKFYDLPKIGSNRSTSFGYGSKMDLSKNGRISPPPNTYSIAS